MTCSPSKSSAVAEVRGEQARPAKQWKTDNHCVGAVRPVDCALLEGDSIEMILSSTPIKRVMCCVILGYNSPPKHDLYCHYFIFMFCTQHLCTISINQNENRDIR